MQIKPEAARRGGLFTLTCAPRMSEARWVVNGLICRLAGQFPTIAFTRRNRRFSAIDFMASRELTWENAWPIVLRKDEIEIRNYGLDEVIRGYPGMPRVAVLRLATGYISNGGASMKLISYGIGTLGIALLTGSLALAQAPFSAAGQPLPEKMTNLQYFPKNATAASVVSTMIAFDESLGITCEYCHVQKPDGKFDFASDEMRAKVVARRMLLFRDSINTILPQVVDKMNVPPNTPDSSIRVLCSTCHRGMPIPKQLTTLVTEAEAHGGAVAGLAKFKELRAKYYGGPSYDFSEDSLVWVAGRSLDAGKPDDAMLYLQANLQYFPKSSETYEAMGQLESVKGDKDGAIKDLEKALELDPNNAVAKTQLQRVKGQ